MESMSRYRFVCSFKRARKSWEDCAFCPPSFSSPTYCNSDTRWWGKIEPHSEVSGGNHASLGTQCRSCNTTDAQSWGALYYKCIISENSKIEKSKRTVWKSGIYLVYNWMICPRNVKKCLNFCCFHLDTCPDAMQLFRLPFRPTAPNLAKDVWVANLHYPFATFMWSVKDCPCAPFDGSPKS